MSERDLVALAQALFATHGVGEYRLELAAGPTRRAGWTVLGGPKVVWLSADFVATAPVEQVWEMVLHELAHVLSGDPTHGWNWRESARSLGCVTAETWPDDVTNRGRHRGLP